MNVTIPVTEEALEIGAPFAVRRSLDLIWLAIIIVLFAGLLGLWHWLDHAMPAPDDSSYILASFQYSDLLKHPKLFRLDWWHSMLTVNRVYPPTVMIFNGVLRAILGFGNWVNILSVMVFNALMTASVYGIVRLLTGDRRAAIFSAIVVNLYPETTCMSHLFALDAPLMSMISVGLFILCWWRANPSWLRALTCGLVLGVACLTKQIAAAYLLGPGAFLLCEAILSDCRNQKWNLSAQLLAVAATAASIGVPWVLINLSYIRFLAQDNQAYMGPLSVGQVFPGNINFYLHSLPSIMSPLLFLGFLLALSIMGKNQHRLLVPLAISAIGGVVLVSTLTWSFPSLRYVAPVMIAAAAYTGTAMSSFLRHRLSSILICTLLGLGIIQFVSFNFAPYPLSVPKLITQASENLGVNLIESFGLTARDRRESQVRHSNPVLRADWGEQWTFSTINQIDKGSPVYLNILPDLGELNGNTFELAGRMMGSNVRPTTSRRWTVMGDKVAFDSKVAMYFQWYLLKSGAQGNLLLDAVSQKNYAQLIDFVQNSGKFQLMSSHRVPDGSTLFLYRQR